MLKKLIIISIALISCQIATMDAQTISRHTVSTSGGTFAIGSSQITHNIGETVIPSLNAGGSIITQGFEQPGEELHTGAIATTVCGGCNISVPFTAIDIGGGNTFTAQLSNATGNFAAPVTIGTQAGNTSGTITATIPILTPYGTGYRIRVISSFPAINGTDNGTDIIISSNPVLSIAVAPSTTICAGDQITLTVAGASTYLWMPGSLTDSIIIVAPSDTTTYTVTGTNAYGCSGSSTVTVNVNTPITWYLDADHDDYGNAGSYLLSCIQPSGFVIDNTDCNDANASVHPGAIDICNGIDDNCNVQTDENGLTITITAQGPTTFCDGGSVILEAPANPLYTYQWLKNGHDINGGTNATYKAKVSANFSVEVIAGLCNATSNVITVTENPVPVSGIIPSGTVTYCKGIPVILTATGGSSGDTYQWKKGGNLISSATNESYTTSADESGTFKVTITSSLGCSNTSAGTTINRATTPNATITITSPSSGIPDLCITSSVKLKANSASMLAYQWNKNGTAIPGETNRNYIVTAIGDYTVTVTNSLSGCSKISATTSVYNSCKEFETWPVMAVQFNLYPNPTSENFVVDLNLNSPIDIPVEIYLVNSLGQVVYSEKTNVGNGKLKKEITMPSTASSGWYIVRVVMSDQVMERKLLYQK